MQQQALQPLPPQAWEFTCLCPRSALLLGSCNQAQTAGKQLSCDKELQKGSQGPACVTLPVLDLMSCQGGTCLITANLPGGHQTAPDRNGCLGPALLCWFGYLRCLPCLPCCHPGSQLASASGRLLLLLPDSLKASKHKKHTHLFLSPHLLSLAFKK